MRRKIVRILIILILIIQLFPYNVFAVVELETAMNAIANFAINFYNKKGTEVSYCHVWKYGGWHYRNDAYTDDKKYINPDPGCPSNYNNVEKYCIDCVGWTNICINRATGLDCGAKGDNDMCFLAGDSGDTTYFKCYQASQVPGGIKPGDLLGNSNPHIMVYVGDNKIIHCDSFTGLTYNTIDEYGGGYVRVYRLNDNALNTINPSDLNNGGDLVVGSSSNKLGKNAVNMSNFYYNGIPDGKYSVTKGFFEMLIEALLDIYVFLVTLMANILRMVFVGWTAVAENLVTSTVKGVAGEKDIEIISSTDMGIDSGKNITVEKIVFNQISIFDVNFFNYNEENP